jgi:hypothetical protein
LAFAGTGQLAALQLFDQVVNRSSELAAQVVDRAGQLQLALALAAGQGTAQAADQLLRNVTEVRGRPAAVSCWLLARLLASSRLGPAGRPLPALAAHRTQLGRALHSGLGAACTAGLPACFQAVVRSKERSDQLTSEAAALLDQLLAGMQADMQQALQAGRASLSTLVGPVLRELEDATERLAGVFDNPAAKKQVLQVGRLGVS